jgi:Skp family chaperone for outer membrane proteins
MQNIRFDKLGWLVAASLAGVMMGSGFQGEANKLGVVDISTVVERSEFGKQSQSTFNQMKTAREGVLEFMDAHRVLTTEQAHKIRDLSLKPNPTSEEKAELERFKSEAVTAERRSKELALKTNLTPEERTLIEEYAKRGASTTQLMDRWYREFMNDLQNWTDKQKMSSIEKARTAIQDVARKEGYTIVYEVGIAPYGANDITDSALKAMNARP